MNCLNPKYGHSSQSPFTCFLCFQTSLFFQRCPSYRTGNLTSVSEFFLLGLSEMQNCSLCSVSCFCPCTWSPCWGTCSSFWPSPDPHLHTPMYFFLSNLVFSWHQFLLHHCSQDDCGHQNSAESSPMKAAWHRCLFLSFLGVWIVYASACDGLWQVCGHLSPTALYNHHEPTYLLHLHFGVVFC